jgi:hypothetical protein
MFKQQEETRKLIARFKAKHELEFLEFQYFEHYDNVTSHNKRKSLISSSRERTSAEIESIPEEVLKLIFLF